MEVVFAILVVCTVALPIYLWQNGCKKLAVFAGVVGIILVLGTVGYDVEDIEPSHTTPRKKLWYTNNPAYSYYDFPRNLLEFQNVNLHLSGPLLTSLVPITGQIINRSNEDTLWEVELLIRFKDCVQTANGEDCVVLGDCTVLFAICIPPGQTQDFEETVSLLKLTKLKPKNHFRWDCKLKHALAQKYTPLQKIDF